MRINEVIKAKGSGVVTAHPDQDVAHLIELLDDHQIGAVVIVHDADGVAGIATERDVVRALRRHGQTALSMPIATIMTTAVRTCAMHDDLETIATTMTEHRIRHIPVMVDEHLAAIVSIGDVVKSRIDQLQSERDELVHYLQS